MVKITGPKKLNGWVLGALFTDGTATTDSISVIAVFRRLPGYKIRPVPAPLKLKKPAGGDDA